MRARLKVNDPLPNMQRASNVGSPKSGTEIVMWHLGESAVDRVSSGEHTVITTPITGSKAIFKPRGLESALTRLSGKLAAETPSLGEAAGRSNHVERPDG